MKDSLMQEFKSYEIDNKAKSEIRGGLKVTGCGQSGSVSYVDVTWSNGTSSCNHQVSTSDPAGWCDNLEM